MQNNNYPLMARLGVLVLLFIGSVRVPAQPVVLQENTTPKWLETTGNVYVSPTVKVGIRHLRPGA